MHVYGIFSILSLWPCISLFSSFIVASSKRSKNCTFPFFTFQNLHTSVPSYLKTSFQHLSSYHNLDTRSQEKSLLLVPQHRTSLYSQSYTVSISRVWNSLSSHVTDCRPLPSFRSKLHEMLVLKSQWNCVTYILWYLFLYHYL